MSLHAGWMTVPLSRMIYYRKMNGAKGYRKTTGGYL